MSKEARKEKLKELLVDEKPEPQVKPSIIKSFYMMFDQYNKFGLTRSDVVHLVQLRTKPRVKIADIKATFKAVEELEEQIQRISRI